MEIGLEEFYLSNADTLNLFQLSMSSLQAFIGKT